VTKVFCFGLGYSAQAFARVCLSRGWAVAGTTRSEEKARQMAAGGIEAFVFDGDMPSLSLSKAIAQATHIVVSIAPDTTGDPVLRHYAQELAHSTTVGWVGYLSTVGVYGNHHGAWVDEETAVAPVSERSIRRIEAENAWLDFALFAEKKLQIFRLAGIYGPGRSAIDKIKAGKARRLIKPGQVFNRIHVDDIAATLIAGLNQPQQTGLFNVADDWPAPPQDVIAFASQLMGQPVPPGMPFETADLTPMARSFYSENKRVRNLKIKRLLGVELSYPTYKEGMAALADGDKMSSF